MAGKRPEAYAFGWPKQSRGGAYVQADETSAKVLEPRSQQPCDQGLAADLSCAE